LAARPRERALRVGIIGCGRAAVALHIPALAKIPGLRISAVCDSDARRPAKVALSDRAVSRHTDYRSLIADPSVDVVLVAVPPAQHAEVFVAAVEAGKHVYAEKPLALGLEEADRMVAAAAASPARCTVGFNLRSHRLVRVARSHLRAGAVGRLIALRTTLIGGPVARPAWQHHAGEGGGAIFELGSHHFDLWRYLLNAEVEEVRAQYAQDANGSTALVSGRLANGAVAVSLLALHGAATHDVEVIGEDGLMRFSLYRGDSLEIGPDGRVTRLAKWLGQLPGAARYARRGGDYLDSFRRHWLRAAACFRGAESPATLEDGRRSLEIALTALESARAGAAPR
jgi:myo-inositol 2-dehydrogenase/D-chiro-inositol 1-dehydrogenase